jgi:hypothetical protein
MKRMIITAIFLVLSFTGSANATDQAKFCDGYKNGYVTGFKQSRHTNQEPLVPACPLAPMKTMNDVVSDFEFGYLRGLEDGYKNKGK